MVENLSPEVWAAQLDSGQDSRRRSCRHQRDEHAVASPRIGDVLREIVFVLVVHALLIVLVLLIVKAFGTH